MFTTPSTLRPAETTTTLSANPQYCDVHECDGGITGGVEGG